MIHCNTRILSQRAGALVSSAPFGPRDVHRVALARNWGPLHLLAARLSHGPAFIPVRAQSTRHPSVETQRNSISLPAPDMRATIPTRTRDHSWIVQRPGASDHKFCVFVVNRHEIRSARLRPNVPPAFSSRVSP